MSDSGFPISARVVIVGGAVGLAMVEGDVVNQAYLDQGQWEVEIAGKTYPIGVSFRPLYDPGMVQVRA